MDLQYSSFDRQFKTKTNVHSYIQAKKVKPSVIHQKISEVNYVIYTSLEYVENWIHVKIQYCHFKAHL